MASFKGRNWHKAESSTPDQEFYAGNGVRFGYQAGVGFDVKKLGIDFRYEGNFKEIEGVGWANANGVPNVGKHSNLLQLTLAYSVY